MRAPGAGALSADQLQFCEVLANATAIALRNARILQSLRDETQRDTRARIEAEKRLNALKRYADLLSSAADGLAAFDAEGRLMFANPSAHTIIGYEPEQSLGMPLWDLVPATGARTIVRLRQSLPGASTRTTSTSRSRTSAVSRSSSTVRSLRSQAAKADAAVVSRRDRRPQDARRAGAHAQLPAVADRRQRRRDRRGRHARHDHTVQQGRRSSSTAIAPKRRSAR